MDKVSFFLSGIVLMAALIGCSTTRLMVNPNIPSVRKVGLGKKIYLDAFIDKQLTKSIRAKLGGESENIIPIATDNEPASTLKKLLGNLFLSAGFEVVVGKKPEGFDQLEMSATVIKQDFTNDFYPKNILGAGNFLSGAIEFEISFQKNGNLIVTERIKGDSSRHVYILKDSIINQFINETWSSALENFSKYISASSFQRDILGVQQTEIQRALEASEKGSEKLGDRLKNPAWK